MKNCLRANVVRLSVGIAVVGLGHLSIGQILPAFGSSKRVRLAGLVSGDSAKAQALATLYGVPAKSVYNYENYELMRENPDINAVYVVQAYVREQKFGRWDLSNL